ncbi:MAG: O-methyltransferase [Syntrophales bacterium]|nr:O-methyltransferase [Syntrophales bacterium]MDD5643757.1 O-methyltransferase [Syntrophales bacterium]
MSMMIPDLEKYFSGFIPPRDALLLELEEEAARESIPIVGPVVGELLHILARLAGAKNILELGTASGYSAIHLARALPPGGKVITLELHEAMAERAKDNFARAGLAGSIEVRVGQALDLMAAMTDTFDLIFLDIDKESYLPAFEHCRRLLKVGGLLIADNVGFAGAASFNREIFSRSGWRVVHLLAWLPRHSPEKDGLSLALRVE